MNILQVPQNVEKRVLDIYWKKSDSNVGLDCKKSRVGLEREIKNDIRYKNIRGLENDHKVVFVII